MRRAVFAWIEPLKYRRIVTANVQHAFRVGTAVRPIVVAKWRLAKLSLPEATDGLVERTYDAFGGFFPATAHIRGVPPRGTRIAAAGGRGGCGSRGGRGRPFRRPRARPSRDRIACSSWTLSSASS